MYVCICLAVDEKEVREAIEGGATTREAVTRVCGAGGDCGACHGMIRDMIEDGTDGLAACPAASAQSTEQLVPETALVRRTAA